jgi:lysophospholipase L1-like esterase
MSIHARLPRHAARLGATFVLLCAAGAAQAQSGFYLKPGDRVVFYGDSITDQRLYTLYTEAYTVTRFPNMPVTFVHSGWGGDRVTGGGGGPIDLRLKRDVLAYKPTVMTIMLGMNDASYRAFDQNIFNTYSTGYERIIDTMKSAIPDLRITVIQPSPYDDVTRAPGFEGGYNNVLLRYGTFVKELAGRKGLHVADLNTGVVAALRKANATDAATAAKIIPDRVHPLQGGHLLMAAELLKSWNAPALVTSVEIDAGTRRVTDARNTAVSGTSWGETISWTQTDRALPFPLEMNDAALALSVRSSDFMEALNQQPLKVTGLTGARYTLKIDGAAVGTFSREDLARGINLASIATPMTRQAMDVLALTRLHNDLHFTRWRTIHVPRQDNLTDPFRKTMDALDRAEADIVRQQRAAAQPKPRRYELIPG